MQHLHLFVAFQQVSSGIAKTFQATEFVHAPTTRIVQAGSGRVGVSCSVGQNGVANATVSKCIDVEHTTLLVEVHCQLPQPPPRLLGGNVTVAANIAPPQSISAREGVTLRGDLNGR